jgi:CubicO group peptidase (beta-lactamase class C family)
MKLCQRRTTTLLLAGAACVLAASVAHPLRTAAFEWQSASPSVMGMDATKLESMRDELAARKTKSLLVVRNDRIVLEWYAKGHGPERLHYTASLAKSLVGGLSLALALDDGLIALEDPAAKHIPAWKEDPLKSKITVLQLATHSSGIEDATDPETEKSHDQLSGWKGDFWRGRSMRPIDEAVRRRLDPFSVTVDHAPVVFEPGSDFAYSNPGMAALSYAVTASLRGTEHADLRSLLRKRVMEPIGIEEGHWQIGYGRTYPVDGLPLVANWGGGNFTARAVARVGRLVLGSGQWEGRQLLRPESIETMVDYHGTALPDRTPDDPFPAPALGWYNNSDGVWPDVPRDAIAGAGAGNQVLFIVPSLDLIVVRNGNTIGKPEEGEGFWAGLEKYLFDPVVAAVADRPTAAARELEPPYPPSPIIRRVNWAPKRSIVRSAEGSDNWPITWADDDAQYTAYGDGWGFEPRVEKKLSMGFAKIVGGPDDFHGVNIRTATGETVGQGPEGKKASGIVMVDGVLYLWVRNAQNSQLAWSRDHGRTWTHADWKFTSSFGAPTFLNFGRDYDGARDEYVYVYSFDSDSAYDPADRMVLARAPTRQITDRTAYEFFVRRETLGEALWSHDVDQRGAVFRHPGQCYRSGISYNAALKRYLWVQVLPGAASRQFRTRDKDPRFRGGFGVYDAPEPWGPWTTVYFTPLWDTGPGESASFPTKWMSEDGRTLHLVFSGEDSFSVRRAVLELRGDPAR